MDTLIILAVTLLLGLIFIVPYIRKVKRREQNNKEKLAKSAAAGLNEPPSLHPLIDPRICIGCNACVVACPEKDILGLIDNEATFQFAAEPQNCLDCHASDFGRAIPTVHLQAAADCETCHTQDQWQGGHDPAAFEIRSGPHEVNCSRCHKNSSDYLSYSCADCHDYPLDEEEHRGIDPQDARCMDCHSENEIGDF